MNLRQQLRLKRSLRNLRTWAPPIAIGVIVGVGFFTLADNLGRPPGAAQPVALETARPASPRRAPQPTVHVVQPEPPRYLEQTSEPPQRVQQPTMRVVQPEPPQYLRRTSASGGAFRNCDAARAAGATPIYSGQDGYAPHLDRDNDGIACEPYHGR